MKIDFPGGLIAKFDASSVVSVPLRERLMWSLEDVERDLQEPSRRDWTWILKPSVTNKGANSEFVFAEFNCVFKKSVFCDQLCV